MARQLDLLSSRPVDLVVDRGRGEPRLWVRRFVLWGDRDAAPLRDLELRRGLNIIWSPDERRPGARTGRRSIGHGAGKTLLCRLLRYALGETHLAAEPVRSSIVPAFPNGAVGVELELAGRPLAVLRPFADEQRVYMGEDLDALRGASGAGDPPRSLAARLAVALVPTEVSERFPAHLARQPWRPLLAWLARDQECRFSHLLDWRAKTSESGTEAIPRAQAARVVRACTGLLDAHEQTLDDARDQLAQERQALEERQKKLRSTRQHLRDWIAGRLGERWPGDALIDLGGARQVAADGVRAAEDRSGLEEHERRIADLDDRIAQCDRRLGAAKAELARESELLAAKERDLRALETGEQALTAEGLEKLYKSKRCYICNVLIREALEDGCGITGERRDELAARRTKLDLARQVANCRAAMDERVVLVAELQTRVDRLETERADLVTRRSKITRLLDGAQGARADRMAEARNTLRYLDSFESTQVELTGVEDELRGLEARDEQIQKALAEARASHQAALQRISSRFENVIRSVVSDEARARIEITADGLRGSLSLGGDRSSAAIASLKAVALDLAVLLLSVEGHAAVPAFLVHDSPREADLGAGIYDALFHFVRQLEDLGPEPPFQYIVTTTTEPPPELAVPPYVVLKLDGSRPEGRLLGRDL